MSSKLHENIFEKAIRVIDSCKSDIHFDGAMKYLQNFKKFGTNKQYEILLNYLHKKLNSNGN